MTDQVPPARRHEVHPLAVAGAQHHRVPVDDVALDDAAGFLGLPDDDPGAVPLESDGVVGDETAPRPRELGAGMILRLVGVAGDLDAVSSVRVDDVVYDREIGSRAVDAMLLVAPLVVWLQAVTGDGVATENDCAECQRAEFEKPS